MVELGLGSSHYATLGISPHATADEVRQAYVGLAKKYHPDKNSSPDATRRMAEINLAYETLCDSARRREYDLEHHRVVALAAGAGGGMQAGAPAQYQQAYGDPGQEEEDDFEGAAGPEPFFVAVCSGCGFIRAGGDRSCSQCGMPFSRAKCSQCNFFNNSGIFVCSVCGYTFDPAGAGGRRKKKEKEEDNDFTDADDGDDADDDVDEPADDNGDDAAGQDAGSEVIRCPQCDEINAYDRGTCWHCRLQF